MRTTILATVLAMMAVIGCGGEPIDSGPPNLDRDWQIEITGGDYSCVGTMTTKSGPGTGRYNFTGFASCAGNPAFNGSALSGYVETDDMLFLQILIPSGVVEVRGPLIGDRLEQVQAAVLGSVASFTAH